MNFIQQNIGQTHIPSSRLGSSENGHVMHFCHSVLALGLALANGEPTSKTHQNASAETILDLLNWRA